VRSVVSPCPAGHQAGDRFVFGQRTPCGLCNEAFLSIYAQLPALQAPSPSATGLDVPCPEHGNVTFHVRPAGT
jgi:uncharacterized repeat protein (TIGR04076 family)